VPDVQHLRSGPVGEPRQEELHHPLGKIRATGTGQADPCGEFMLHGAERAVVLAGDALLDVFPDELIPERGDPGDRFDQSDHVVGIDHRGGDLERLFLYIGAPRPILPSCPIPPSASAPG